MNNELQCCFRRYEKKYLLTQEQYRSMKHSMASFIEPDVHPRYTICNIYYDTAHYDLIRRSLEKPVYKEKLRLRSYGVPKSRDPVFVEIKKKYDGVVYKRRVTMETQDAMRYLQGAQNGDGSQISREIGWFLKYYQPEPKVFIAYDREAYAAADGGELRITFDTALRVRSDDVDLRFGDHGLQLVNNDPVLMEIKIPGTSPLWLAELLSRNSAFPVSFSKYGTYYEQFVLGGKSAAIRKEILLSA
ncbi:MAG: polyphosphate polymerase domain-containing protein [Bacteroidales bacterium]|nr:polyphosphate polymerase domain-containing protein [Bacteroidales bacterium]